MHESRKCELIEDQKLKIWSNTDLWEALRAMVLLREEFKPLRDRSAL